MRYRGYYYDSDTQLYYLQSRYYDPALGRFINADAFTSTGQGILGNNMFAYCNNNPIMYTDHSGHWAVDWDLYHNQQSGKAFGEWIVNQTEADKDAIEHGMLTYTPNGKNGETEITNSYKVRTPWVMYSYVEKNRGNEVSGSTMGVVWEWMVHNWGHTIGTLTNNTSWIKSGKDVNFGKTIYSDKRVGAMGLAMKLSYQILFPIYSQYDLNVHKLSIGG